MDDQWRVWWAGLAVYAPVTILGIVTLEDPTEAAKELERQIVHTKAATARLGNYGDRRDV
jgi:hypothetical protein